MPPGITLTSGYQLVLNAVDPTNGDQVTGVVIENAVVFVDNLAGTSNQELASGPFVLVSGSQG